MFLSHIMIFGMYKVIYDNSSLLLKDRENLKKDKSNFDKIRIKIETLCLYLFNAWLNIKKLEPKKDNKYRLRIDDYRVIFSIDFWNKIIIIHRIWLRKEVYKN